jgi:thiol:disulfide interchange protein DsbD
MTIRIATAALASIALAATATAQTPVHWTATAASHSVAPGAKTDVTLSASIEEGWHIYSLTQGPGGPIPSKISVPAGQSFALAGDIKASAPDVKVDPNFGIQVETYEKKAEFTVPIKVKKNAKLGSHKAQIAARYEACNASMCLPPRTDKVAVDMRIRKDNQ